MEFTRAALSAAGFKGFVPFSGLSTADVPRGPGVSVVTRADDRRPVFLDASGAGWFNDKDPTISHARLEAAWVYGGSVVYIGKAGAGVRGNRGLRVRLGEYRRHGVGDKVGHWGGRYVWQLEEHAELVVAWKETPDEDPEDVESELIANFIHVYGTRPFANRKAGKAARRQQRH
jgi:hypothetical protein